MPDANDNNTSKNMNLLSSADYEYLKQNLLKLNPNFNNIKIETQTFPDREQYWRIENPQDLSGKPAVYICGTVDDKAVFEAYNIACGLVGEGCSSLHLVIPYFGYSTMERAVKPGEVVTAKNISRLFSSIPLSAQGNYIYMFDLHAPCMAYYFEQNVHPVHLTTEPLIDKIIADIRAECGDVILASADIGRAKQIEKISQRLQLEDAYVIKERISGSETVVKALKANVKDKNVVIFDDMVRTGGSIINAAKSYKKAGAKDIYVICVHGIFADDAVKKFKKSGLIKTVYCTNTHSNAQNIKDDFVKIYDISEIILKGLRLSDGR